jgi:hypothetical protein
VRSKTGAALPVSPTIKAMRTIGNALAILAAAGAMSSPASAGKPTATTTSDPLVVRVQGGGFQWEDAAIGAATGFGVSLVVVGGIALKRTPSVQTHLPSHQKGVDL